jgi:hypothetical protein
LHLSPEVGAAVTTLGTTPSALLVKVVVSGLAVLVLKTLVEEAQTSEHLMWLLETFYK